VSKEIAQSVFDQVRENFVYTSDKEQYEVNEDWRSHVDEIKAGQVWRDDCDGFAASAMELAVEQGARAAIAYCKVETGGGHAVCLVWEGEGAWVIDNRQRFVCAWDELPYEWISANDGSGWKEIS